MTSEADGESEGSSSVAYSFTADRGLDALATSVRSPLLKWPLCAVSSVDATRFLVKDGTFVHEHLATSPCWMCPEPALSQPVIGLLTEVAGAGAVASVDVVFTSECCFWSSRVAFVCVWDLVSVFSFRFFFML
jgi:hypothetical protein